MKIEIRPAVLADARYVGRHLRDSDRCEVEALGLRPLDAVVISFSGSDLCLTGLIDDVPAMVFGVGRPLLASAGGIWALGTATCDRAPVAMVKVGRAVVAEFLKLFPELENYCGARYEKSLRWLKLIGFTIGEPEPYGPNGAMFCKLSIKRGGE